MGDLSDKALRLIFHTTPDDELCDYIAALESVASAAREYVEPISRDVPFPIATRIRLDQQAALTEAIRRLDGAGEGSK